MKGMFNKIGKSTAQIFKNKGSSSSQGPGDKKTSARRHKVRANEVHITEASFVPKRVPKSDVSKKFLKTCLTSFFIFDSLSASDQDDMVDAMVKHNASEGTVIIKQGDIGDFFYVVESGEVSFLVDGNECGKCGPSGMFGELALLYNAPRAATCRALSECKLWKVDQVTFQSMIATKQNRENSELVSVLKKVKLFENLDQSQLSKISNALTTVTFKKNEKIVNKGDIGEVFYILQEGTAKVHDIGFGDSQYMDQSVGGGDFFGERALLTGEPRAANITATSNCTLLCLSRETFEQTIGKLENLMERAMKKQYLMGVPIFANSKFYESEMEDLTDKLKTVHFKKGTKINDTYALYVIQQGSITVSLENGMINTMKPGDHFGGYNLQEKIAAPNQTLEVKEDSTCVMLTKEDIEAVIGSVSRLGKPVLPISSKFDRSIKLNDIVKSRMLGQGTFGKVWLCTLKKDRKTPYALKCMAKSEIIAYGQVKGVIREKNVMASIDHPFLVNIVGAFQDDTTLYMLQTFLQGGELFSVIHTDKGSGVPSSSARFYGACTLDGLSHLHARNICYRDLKPENSLVDAEGYAIIIDLGFAKIVHDKTFTLCGTPEYLAPEIILSKGHNRAVDYWALGVLLYELLVGNSPFFVHGADQTALFRKIVQVKYSFPAAKNIPEEAKDMIRCLLMRNQSKRIGMLSGGVMDIHNHPFFDGLNWEQLLKKEVASPWIPNVKDPLDSSKFEDFSYEETHQKAGKKLSKSQQEFFVDF